jgi:hypothetical protein
LTNQIKDIISDMYKMEEEETVTLPKAPEGYEYTLRKKTTVSDKDPSDLTARQLATKKYREKNRQKLAEYSREYQKKKREENS